MNTQKAKLIAAMVDYDGGDPLRIQHFMKVHGFAVTIGVLENIDPDVLDVLETAAILHDIGIHISEMKYGSSAGKYQEIEGPDEAEKLMRQVGGFSQSTIERVRFLIANHHTYDNVVDIDHQILIEADFLVNLFEYQLRYENVLAVNNNIFRTQTGIQLLNDMYAEKYSL